jgi:hypothetical protein
MGTRGEDWTEEEMLRSLAFYVSLGGRPHTRAELETLALRMPNRDASTINFRMGNYIARDPAKLEQGLTGLTGSGKKATEFVGKYLLPDGSFDLHKLLMDCSNKL